jgi:hypothetical protein
MEKEPEEIEALAKVLHLAGKEAVLRGATVIPNPMQGFLEWNEISEGAKEGRRIQARYLLDRGLINVPTLFGIAAQATAKFEEEKAPPYSPNE